MIRETVLSYLRTRDAKLGQTVQFGWFIFRIVEGRYGIDLETLDFQAMASFTSDFQIPEQIHCAQHETLRRLGSTEMECKLTDPALVSRSYFPLARNAYIERCQPASEGDCGWYVGVVNETLDMGNPNSFVHQSLYELTINDERLARFWLLSVGYRVYFDGEEPRVEQVPRPE